MLPMHCLNGRRDKPEHKDHALQHGDAFAGAADALQAGLEQCLPVVKLGPRRAAEAEREVAAAAAARGHSGLGSQHSAAGCIGGQHTADDLGLAVYHHAVHLGEGGGAGER